MLLASEGQSSLSTYQTTPQISRPSLVNTPLPTPTVSPIPSPHHVQPRSTPSPTCCAPNQVIIELSTAIVIKDYQRFYSTDINSFSPTYFVTDDGSLITPALTSDLWNANLNLLLTGALAVLFFRNIAVAIDYLRRGKMKNKILFYLLFASQALAPASLIPMSLSFFNQYINCTVVMALSSAIGSFSLAILLTGIIGIKTYRCMNDSIIVLAVVAVLELGHSAFVILDTIAVRGERRIAGSCLCVNDLRYTRTAVACQMVECCFMMLCFVYTSIKYRKTPGARGRISLRMSMEELPLDSPHDANFEGVLVNGGAHQPNNLNQKIDLSAMVSGGEPPHASAVVISSEAPINHPDDYRSYARKSFASSFSRLSRLLSNMVNLRKVMRDELLYTCVITVIITFALVFTFTGLNVNSGLGVSAWITLTWGLVSVFVIHSTGRVVRRHERESLMRYATSRAISHGGLATPRFGGANALLLTRNSSNIRNRRTVQLSQNTQFGDPFSETRQLRQDQRPSFQSGMSSSTGSNPPSPLEPIIGIASLKDPGRLPSSGPESDFPTSGRVTPVVMHERVEGNLESFSQSWLLEHDAKSSIGSIEQNHHKF